MSITKRPLTTYSVCLTTALIATATLTGCGGDEESTADAGTSTSDTAKTSITHAMGTTEVACTPKKVVTLGQGQTDTVLALGVTPVGVVAPFAEKFYEYLPKEVNDAKLLGSELEPDLEAIAELQPDVILGSKVRHEKFYDKLAAIAPTVLAESIGEPWKDNVTLWGKALCLEDKAKEVMSAYDKRAAEVAKTLIEKNPDGVEASMVRFSPKHVRLYRTGFPGVVLKDAGFKRPASQQPDPENAPYGITNISEERIPDMDGDMIFVMISKGEKGEEVKKTWEKNPLWGNLEAVKNDKVYTVNEQVWNLGGGLLAAHAMLDDLEARIKS